MVWAHSTVYVCEVKWHVTHTHTHHTHHTHTFYMHTTYIKHIHISHPPHTFITHIHHSHHSTNIVHIHPPPHTSYASHTQITHKYHHTHTHITHSHTHTLTHTHRLTLCLHFMTMPYEPSPIIPRFSYFSIAMAAQPHPLPLTPDYLGGGIRVKARMHLHTASNPTLEEVKPGQHV